MKFDVKMIGMIVLGALIGVVLMYVIYGEQNVPKENVLEQELIAANDSIIKLNAEKEFADEIGLLNFLTEAEKCKFIPEATDGDTINMIAAKKALQVFIDRRSTDSIYAYHIGLGDIKAMLGQADTYNLGLAMEDSARISGFRFYQAVTTRTLSNKLIENRKDLIGIPVKLNGYDVLNLYQEDPSEYHYPNRSENILLYSKFRPCPKICGKK